MPSLEIMKQCLLNIPVNDYWIISSFVKLYDSMLASYKVIPEPADTNIITLPEDVVEKTKEKAAMSASTLLQIEAYFIFCSIWTFGALLATQNDRDTYDEFLRERIGMTEPVDESANLTGIKRNLTSKSLISVHEIFKISDNSVSRPNFTLVLKRNLKVFDIIYDKERKDWVKWGEDSHDPHTSATESTDNREQPVPELIIVPTSIIMKTSFILKQLADSKKNVLLIGQTGTGKSILIRQIIKNQLGNPNSLPLFIPFNSNTTPSSLQDIIESKLERHRKGVLEPILGKYLIVIAEDVHMANADSHGTKPTLELMRQFFDHEGLYDSKFNDFKRLENVFFLASLAARPGQPLPSSTRILRHFTLIPLPQPTDKSLHEIFDMIFSEISSRFSERATRGLEQRIVDATISLFFKIENEFRPTPNRIHYTFNIREINSLFKGMSICNPKSIRKKENLVRL